MKATLVTPELILLIVAVNTTALTIMRSLRQLRLLRPLPTVGWNQ
jgi:hypothetical protein